MKTAEQKSTHSQQPQSTAAIAEKPFFEKEQKQSAFSKSLSEPVPFFGSSGNSSIQAKSMHGRSPFFQPTLASSYVARAGEEPLQKEEPLKAQPSVQRIPAFESEAAGEHETTPVQRQTATEPAASHPLLQLQRKLGNRAVTQLIQAKLTVGKPNDHYEQEADRVANTVMRMADPAIQRQGEEKKEEVAQTQPLVGSISPFVQRQTGEKEESAQAKSNIGTITPIVQRQAEERKEEPAQTLQRQAEEKKEEPIQALQRQAEEKKEESAQTLQRQAEEKQKEPVQAKETATATPQVSGSVESNIQSMRGGGKPLDDSTRGFFESRFGHDFGGVRVHTDANASEAATNLNAQAFTIQRDIFFNQGRYEPQTSQGKWLLAHELTHTVQQAPQPLASSPSPATTTTAQPYLLQPKFSVATTSSPAIAQRYPLSISSATTQIQPALSDYIPSRENILRWVADKAANVPGFTLLTFVLGRNPITDHPVEQNAVNLVRGVLGLVPGGDLIFKTLQESGVLDLVFNWLSGQLQQLNITWEGIKALFAQAWASIDLLTDRFEGSLAKVKAIFGPTTQRVITFASSVVGKVIDFIKEAILKPVGQFVKEKVPGFKLLTVILGKDPVTGEPVERNATNFIGGFLEFVPGGQETFKNLQESGAIARASTWLDQQIKILNLTWEGIKTLFQQAWNALGIADITSPLKAFEKIWSIFGTPIIRIKNFAVAVGKKVLEFIFEGVLKLAGPFAGAIMEAVRQAGDVFSKIIQNPIGFAGNLIKAVKNGFLQFMGNIDAHLKSGLIGWVVGALAAAGLVVPQKLDMEGMISLAMQVVGATYARLRELLVKLVGEKTVARIEKVFDFVVAIATRGISAAWEKITEFVGSLADMVINAVKGWVVTKVVTSAVTKLLTMLNPVGALIQSIISVYNTIAFFMERAQQIAMLVTAVTKSIASIAAGAIGNAANFIEQSMAKAIPVILGFLARFIGLGNVSEAIQKAIKALQDKIWGAITKLANFIISKAKSLLGVGKDKEAQPESTDPEHEKKVQAGLSAISQGEQKYLKGGKIEKDDAEKVAIAVKANHPIFKSLTVVDGGETWDYAYVASPGSKFTGEKKAKADRARMRSQIQRGDDHLGSCAVEAAQPDKGVTAIEFEQKAMLGALRDYKDRIDKRKRPFGSRANESQILGAFARQSQLIRSSIVPNGVTKGGDINALRQLFKDVETRQDIRVDAENLEGHNLRYKN